MQNVFIKLMNCDLPFENEEHEKAWLIRCATNYCKDILKSSYKKRTDFDTPDVIDETANTTETSEVYEAVLNLPPKYKDCVYLHYYEGYKTDEIATICEKPASTIRNYLSEARALLRNALGGDSHG